MKAVILTISAGGGHNTAAKAINECFSERSIETVTIDAYKYFNKYLSDVVENGYLFSTKYVPKLYGKFYRMAEKKSDTDIKMKMGAFGTALVLRKFARFIAAQNADVIIATHIFAGELLTILREKGILDESVKTVGIVTDFTVHPFWEETNLDYYVTASELLNYQMVKKGIPEDKILPFGIPVHPKFSKKISKHEARGLLGVPNKDTVFVIAGSMGFGDVAHHIKNLDKSGHDFQIIAVCGNNKKLKAHLEKMKDKMNKDMFVYGFVNNVDVIMDAADCIVTKPGGLTVSEALAKKMHLILIDPIPGQEDRNSEFLLNCGVAIKVSETCPVDEAVHLFYDNKIKTEYYDRIIDAVAKPDAGMKLGEFVEKVCRKD